MLVVASGYRPAALFPEDETGRLEVVDAGGWLDPAGVAETWAAAASLEPAVDRTGVGATCEGRACSLVVPDLANGAAGVGLWVDGDPPALVASGDPKRTVVGMGSLEVTYTVPETIPAGARVMPIVTWYHKRAGEVAGPDGARRPVVGSTLRDGVVWFADASVIAP